MACGDSRAIALPRNVVITLEGDGPKDLQATYLGKHLLIVASSTRICYSSEKSPPAAILVFLLPNHSSIIDLDISRESHKLFPRLFLLLHSEPPYLDFHIFPLNLESCCLSMENNSFDASDSSPITMSPLIGNCVFSLVIISSITIELLQFYLPLDVTFPYQKPSNDMINS
ncbi:hypothetical protein V6N13_029928 [Hibiscus sabdariffa]